MKNWLKENWFKVGLLVVLLILGLSFAYYYIVFLPKKEQNRLAQEIQKQTLQESKEIKEREKTQSLLDECLADAETSYSDQWYGECKSQGKITSKCISLKEMTFNEYAKQNNIPDDGKERLDAMFDFFKQQNECSCRLPLANADRINGSLEKSKDECFKRYPQN